MKTCPYKRLAPLWGLRKTCSQESWDITLTPDGQLRPELFRADSLYLSPAGYKLLADRVRPFLPKQ